MRQKSGEKLNFTIGKGLKTQNGKAEGSGLEYYSTWENVLSHQCKKVILTSVGGGGKWIMGGFSPEYTIGPPYLIEGSAGAP